MVWLVASTIMRRITTGGIDVAVVVLLIIMYYVMMIQPNFYNGELLKDEKIDNARSAKRHALMLHLLFFIENHALYLLPLTTS